MRSQLGPPAIEQRTDDEATARMHRCEPSGAGAPQQTQQKGFGLIVACVPQRHDVGAQLGSRTIEETISCRPRSVFNRAVFPSRDCTDILAPGHETIAERRRHPDAKSLVLIGLRAEPVVEVGQSRYAQLSGAREAVQEMGKRNGVRTTRDGDEDGGIPCGELVPPDCAPDTGL
jgi:hypothetical protein